MKRNRKSKRRCKIFVVSALVTLFAAGMLGVLKYALDGGFGPEAKEAARQQEVVWWEGEPIAEEDRQTAEAGREPIWTASPAPEEEPEEPLEFQIQDSSENAEKSEDMSQASTESAEGTGETGETLEPMPTPFVCPKPAGLTWPDSALEDGQIIVMLDAGHGGKDSGTMTKDESVYEKEITLSIVEKMKSLMEERGVTVLLTREGDEFVSLEDRAEICNSSDTDVFVSIHVNSYDSPKVGGLECYYYGESSACKALAGDVVSHLETQADIPMRGLREYDYFVLRSTACPAILVETGYITNQKDASNLLSDEFREKLAQALVDGILNPLGY